MQEIIKDMVPHTTTRVLSKGATLLYQSEIPRTAFIVNKGVVRAYNITSSGEERTVALHTRGDVFPLSWIYGETRNTLYYYEALEDCELLCVPKNTFVATVSDNPLHMTKILQHVVNEHTAQQMRITALEQPTALEKITLTLYYLLIRHGVERKPGYYTINVKLNHSTIASLVGLTRESTATHISSLKKNDVLSYKSFVYIVHKPSLERFISEDSFKNIVLS